jgi:hypothetical protein
VNFIPWLIRAAVPFEIVGFAALMGAAQWEIALVPRDGGAGSL